MISSWQLRVSLSALAFTVLAVQVQGWAFTLISAEEARVYGVDSGSVLMPLSVPTNALPAIEVINPQILAGPVPSPVSIELSFKTDDAAVDISSFRALYGGLRLNITDRIMAKARVTPTGLRIENAEIPAGNHRLFLSISDSKGRRSDRELRFKVK